MKRIVILIAMLMLISVNAYAVQKLINITEDTIPEDSYRPVVGKEFLVAVKMVDVDVELNTEQPISNEPIIFQTNIGTLSEAEVTTNIYGEAITWLTADTTPDTTHSITASVKDKPEITPITIQVKNIALPQDAPTANELIQKVDDENSKIQDMIAEVEITSNEPWRPSIRRIKTWEKKGEKLKVQEISPTPGIFIQPVIPLPSNPPSIMKDIIAFDSYSGIYKIQSKEETLTERYPVYYDYIDNIRGVIIKKESYSGEADNISKISTDYSIYQKINGIWVLQGNEQYINKGISKITFTKKYANITTSINTSIPDSEFTQ